MSQMLEALRRIESQTVATRGQNGDISPELRPGLGVVADSDQKADKTDANDGAEGSIVWTSPRASCPEITQTVAPRRLGGPRAKASDQAYLELAQAVTSRSANRETAILFTSPGDGEGKTSTVIGLAEVLASQDWGEVLAVDGNPRRPGLTDWMDIEADRGLADVLSGEASWPEVIRTTRIDHLSILPSRAEPPGDAPPVDTVKLADLLSELRREFPLVLFDGASLRYPEVAQTLRHFDQIYLVIELNRTSRNEAKQAVRIIDNCQGRLLGCVLTNQGWVKNEGRQPD